MEKVGEEIECQEPFHSLIAPASMYALRLLQGVRGSQKAAVYLVPYLNEEFRKLAEALKMSDVPRAHFQHVGLLPFK